VERTLRSVVQEAYVQGVSTRKPKMHVELQVLLHVVIGCQGVGREEGWTVSMVVAIAVRTTGERGILGVRCRGMRE